MQTTRKQPRGVSSSPTPSILNITLESLFSVSILHTTKTAYSGQHERRNSSNSSRATATRCGMLRALSTLRRAKFWGVMLYASTFDRLRSFISYLLHKWQTQQQLTAQLTLLKSSSQFLIEKIVFSTFTRNQAKKSLTLSKNGRQNLTASID